MLRTGMATRVILAALLGWCALAGCSQRPSDDPFKTFGPISDLKQGRSISAQQLMPLRPHHGTIQVAAKGEPERIAAFTVDGRGNQWRETIEDLRTVHLQLTVDGAVVTPTVDETAEGVQVTFDPPVVSLPATLTVGQSFESTSQMKVYSLDGAAKRDEGTCQYEVSLRGTRSVTTPAGRLDAYVVRTTRQINLKHAKSRVVSEADYVPGQGMVQSQLRRTTRILGMVTLETWQVLRVVE